jgi:HEAT repeat protein
MSGFNFDLQNFGLGLAVGWASAYAAYRARRVLGAARDSVSRQAAGAQEYAIRNADSRYINDLIKYCEADHLAGKAINLSQIVVEPRFIPAPDLEAPVDDDVVYDVFYVVPAVSDHPYLHAPYNIETLSIDELDNGDRAVALLGPPGSGRTTALHTIALWSLGKVRFDPPRDLVQERLDAEEKELNDEERAQRIKDRNQVQQMAMQSLARRKGADTVEADDEDGQQIRTTLLKHLTPVYVHFGNINVRGEFGRQVDPAEPLVRAVQHYVGPITARAFPINLYERLGEGKVLVLLDGYDDVPAEQQPEKLAWLRAFVREYAHNFIICTGPAAGYGPLVQAGLAPVYLRPWHDIHSNALIEKWAEAWPQISKLTRRRAASRPGDNFLEIVRENNRGLSPLELTLKVWSLLEDPDQFDYEGQLRALLARYLPDESLGAILPQLVMAASLQLDEGYITIARLQQLGIAEHFGEPPPPPGKSSVEPVMDQPAAETEATLRESDFVEDLEDDAAFEAALDEIDEDLFDEDAQPQTSQPAPAPTVDQAPASQGDKQAKAEADARRKEEARISREYARLVATLHKSGLLRNYRHNRYQFRHPVIAAYLASLALREMSAEGRVDKAYSGAWQPALAHATMHTPLEDVIALRLDAPADVLHNHLLETAHWLRYAGSKAEWRSTVLKRLGNLFVAPNQYRLLRERVAAALIGTRDKTAQVIFRKAISHPNPDVRRLACLGLGALRAEDHIDDLVNLLQDENADVMLSAGLALGAIGTDAALEEMIIALTRGTERLRQAVAEAFAALPDEGYPVLYDASQHEDMMIRRAAVFGLRRVNTAWALITLYRTSLEDDQWYVRSAAEQAFQDMEYGDIAGGPRRYPEVGSIPWLREWIASLGDGAVREGQSPDMFLVRALEEGDPEIQRLSVTNLGQLGMVAHVGLVYTALRHRSPQVREAAHRALGDLQLQLGHPLPAPV